MSKLLVVVDYQKDFVEGALGFEKAKTLEGGILVKASKYIEAGDKVILTYDTHDKNYLNTREGKNLPVEHCKQFTEGWLLYGKVRHLEKYGNVISLTKESFGVGIDTLLKLKATRGYEDFDEIELIGIVTNMCVISNAVMFQTAYPNAQLTVDASLCASFDNALHEKALDVMKGMQINVINREKTFYGLYKAGELGKESIFDYIEKWCKSKAGDGLKLHEYLGMTEKQYQDFFAKKKAEKPTKVVSTGKLGLLRNAVFKFGRHSEIQEGHEFRGIIGTKTGVKIGETDICVGDIVEIGEGNLHDELTNIVMMNKGKPALYGVASLSFEDLPFKKIYKSHKELKAGDKLGNNFEVIELNSIK